MKKASILFLSILGAAYLSTPAQAERLTASQVWFDSPGNKSAYEKQIATYIAGEMLKSKGGFYDRAVYHVTNATYLNVGAYLQITNSTIPKGANIYAYNCGSTTQQVTQNSDDGSETTTQDTDCTVGYGGGYE